MPISLNLQEYINVVYIFQHEFIPHFDELKDLYEFNKLEPKKVRRNISGYHKLLKVIIFNEIYTRNFSISSIVMLDRITKKFQIFFAPKKECSGLLGFVARLDNQKYMNRLSLDGYIPDRIACNKARKDLFQLMSIDENFNLIYKIPEILSKEKIFIFNQY